MRKGSVKSDVDVLNPPNIATVGGRLRSERARLRLDLGEVASLMGVTEQKLTELEATLTSVKYSTGLKRLAQAGFDVLWVMIELRNEVGMAEGRAAGDEVRYALAQMAGIDRQRLLLHLVTLELKQLLGRP